MKAIALSEFGGPEVLGVHELPSPEPGPHEVRIRVQAVGVNPTDLTFRAGGRAAQLADRTPPYIPGVDAAGYIDKIGADVGDRLSVGQNVVAFVVPFEANGGSYAEEVIVNEAAAVAAPEGRTPAEASTLLLNAVTAHLGLDALRLDAGDTVAVTGAAGALGGYAIELAKLRGLRVIADASDADRGLVASLGADSVVARGPGFAAEVRELEPAGVRGVIDAAGLTDAVVPAIADGGSIAVFRSQDVAVERGISVERIAAFGSARDTALLERLSGLAASGALSLRVAEVLPAEHAADAHRRLANGGVRGRLVLDFS